MKNLHKHLVARTLVGLSLLLGIGFWMGHFVVNAASWTVGGITRNNANFLSGAFWDNSPTSGDIIKALYGSGGESTAYTSNWSGYTSGTCLSGGMTVVYTGEIPSTISANTIYVLASGTYNLDTDITLENCVAFVSSGTVILSGGEGDGGILTISQKNNIILDHININNTYDGGMDIYTGTNFTINAGIFSTSIVDQVGISMTNSSYGAIVNSQISDNEYGIMISNGNNLLLSGLEIYNNSNGGIHITGSQTISFINTLVYNNDGYGVNTTNISASTFTDVEAYDNIGHNIFLSDSSDNTFTSIVANGSETAMGIYLGNSSGNTFSGITAYGNYYAGVHLYNSNSNTGINIVSNSNEGGLYMENSSGNNFNNFTIENSTSNGVVFSGSDYNILSGLIASGNMSRGLYLQTSDNNTLKYSSINNNTSGGIGVLAGINNIITDNNVYENIGGGIVIQYSSGTTIGNSNIYDNSNDGIILGYSTGNIMDNLSLINNRYGIDIIFSQSNIISGCSLSGNNNVGIYLYYGSSNTIINSNNYSDEGEGGYSLLSNGYSIENSFINFSGNTWMYISAGRERLYNYFDTNTKLNNEIVGSFAPYSTLTGTSPIGYILNFDFDYFNINGYEGYLYLSGVESFTVSGAERDGTIYTPTTITSGNKLAVLGDDGTQLFSQIFGTAELIPGSGYLTMSGGIGTVYFYVLSGTSGQYLNILKSNNGEIRNINVTDSGCILNEDLRCDFTTTGDIKLFAFGVPGVFFTGMTMSGTQIVSGGYYNTGVYIDFTGYDLSGATLDGDDYLSGTVITGNGTYAFVVSNIRGDSTGMTFTIDTTTPTLTGASSGAYYSGNVTITGSDDVLFSGFVLSGTTYTGSSLTVTGDGIRVLVGYDRAGNSTGITFIIDKTTPAFTGTTLSGTSVVSGGYYNTGVSITFADTNLSGATLNGSGYASGDLITTGGTYIFVVSDVVGHSTGMTFTIDTTAPSVTNVYPTSGLNYTGGVSGNNNITFTRTGLDSNMDSYMLYVNGSGYGPTSATGYTLMLENGSYTRYVIATDLAGNTGTSTTMPFTLETELSATITITGTNIVYNGSNPYTSGYVSLYLVPNQPCNYIVTGDVYEEISGSITSRVIVSPTLTGTNEAKTISVLFTNTSGDVVTGTKTVYFDNTAPTPTLTSPISGATITGSFSLVWPSAGADNVGLSGYQYFVTTTGTVGTGILKSGSVSTATLSAVITTELFGSTGTYYRYVKTLDKLGNMATSAVRPFYYSGVADTTPNAFSFNAVTNARLDRVYGSNTVTITGMTASTSVLASVNRGVLYISGNAVGTTGYVQNGWTVKIELISSDEYETQVNSTLTIGGVTSTFRVTTMDEADDTSDDADYEDIETDLSSTERLQIIAIFETLRDLYNGDKEEEFFSSLMVMLESKLDDLDEDDDEYDALQYLYDLAEQYYDDGFDTGTGISGTSWIVNGVYTAPNGKKYTITYDSVRKQFTSSNFITPKYYPTLDVLKYDIDRNNPAGTAYANAKVIKARWGKVAIDGTWQTSAYTAPNRKVFYFFKTTGGRYSSYTFTTEKYFDSLELTKEHIYNNNR